MRPAFGRAFQYLAPTVNGFPHYLSLRAAHRGLAVIKKVENHDAREDHQDAAKAGPGQISTPGLPHGHSQESSPNSRRVPGKRSTSRPAVRERKEQWEETGEGSSSKTSQSKREMVTMSEKGKILERDALTKSVYHGPRYLGRPLPRRGSEPRVYEVNPDPTLDGSDHFHSDDDEGRTMQDYVSSVPLPRSRTHLPFYGINFRPLIGDRREDAGVRASYLRITLHRNPLGLPPLAFIALCHLGFRHARQTVFEKNTPGLRKIIGPIRNFLSIKRMSKKKVEWQKKKIEAVEEARLKAREYVENDRKKRSPELDPSSSVASRGEAHFGNEPKEESVEIGRKQSKVDRPLAVYKRRRRKAGGLLPIELSDKSSANRTPEG